MGNDGLKIEYPERKPAVPEVVIDIEESNPFGEPISVDEVYNDKSSND